MPQKEVLWMLGMTLLKAPPFLPVVAFLSISYWPTREEYSQLSIIRVNGGDGNYG
jgi:hypothetical protein